MDPFDQRKNTTMTTPGANPMSDPQSGFIFTPRAICHTLEICTQTPHDNFSSLRIYLAGKICDGFTYGVQFDDPLPEDLRFDLYFSHDPKQYRQGEVPLVICDPQSYSFVKGSSIDYVNDDRGQGYLVSNPHHDDYQGKFYKDPAWQDLLNQL